MLPYPPEKARWGKDGAWRKDYQKIFPFPRRQRLKADAGCAAASRFTFFNVETL